VPQEFRPTANEDKLIGGIQNFGADKFVPLITNLSGDYKLRGTVQRVGRILHFGILIEADGGEFELASSVLSLPRTPFKRTVNAVADTTVYQGVCHQNGAAFTTIAQNSNGTFSLVNETRTGLNTWITGYYWVE
jgi:hypothetical protein